MDKEFVRSTKQSVSLQATTSAGAGVRRRWSQGHFHRRRHCHCLKLMRISLFELKRKHWYKLILERHDAHILSDTSDSNEHLESLDSRLLPRSSSRPSADRNDIFLPSPPMDGRAA